MGFLGRARYNLLQQNYLQDDSLQVEDWQVIDYSLLSINQLFSRLRKMGMGLSEGQFKEIAQETDSPEELTECLTLADPKCKKRVYLVVFELWKRLITDRESISIFCDKLDWALFAYDEDPKENSETVQTYLMELSEILDSNIDQGGKPKPLFAYISRYLAADLESHIYGFIYDQIELGNKTIASKILERFYEFVKESEWFDFLKIKLMQGVPSEDATAVVARFLDELKIKPNIELSFEILHYFLETGHIEPFLDTYKNVVQTIKTEEEFGEMLALIYQFYALNDRKEEENFVRSLIIKRKEMPKEQKITLKERNRLSSLATAL